MKLNIAVIGSSSAGATAALYFHRNCHEVTVFEREATPTPVGAGIMLQPTALNTLADLGLAKKAIKLGHKINGINGVNKNGKPIIDFKFNSKDNLTGLGINRGALYFLMIAELIRQKINITFDAEIVSIKNANNKKTIYDKKGNTYEGFDLIVVASGARSVLRKGNSYSKIDQAQEYGALWARIQYDNNYFNNKIHQKYDGSHTMIGFMPMGKPDLNSPEEVNFFWSIKSSEIKTWDKENFNDWKNKVKQFCPEHAHVIDRIQSKDEIMVAPYLDVVLKKPYKDNVVFIGDAAHPMSPQLAQGAGFAMLDARILAENIENHVDNINLALSKYHKKRSKQVYFYQSLSRWLTPMFQSNTSNTGLRDCMFYTIRKLSLFKGLINSIMLGYRESYFKNIEEKYYTNLIIKPVNRL